MSASFKEIYSWTLCRHKNFVTSLRIFLNLFLFVYLFVCDRVLLYNQGYPQTHDAPASCWNYRHASPYPPHSWDFLQCKLVIPGFIMFPIVHQWR
jgi:hypothetical protein